MCTFLIFLYFSFFFWNYVCITVLCVCVLLDAGIPNLITADMIKEGAAVIDVGINRVQDPVTGKSRLVGDVDFEGTLRLECELLQ